MNQDNQKFIIRTDRAGVFFAKIAERRGSEIDLTDARRIYSWRGAATLSQLSQEGCAPQSQITMSVPSVTVLGAIEIIPCSEEAQAKLEGHPEWKI